MNAGVILALGFLLQSSAVSSSAGSWGYRVEAPVSVRLRTIRATGSGDLIVAGDAVSSTDRIGIAVLGVGADGDLEWARQLTVAGASPDLEFRGLAASKMGGALILARTSSSSRPIGHLMRIGSSGEVRWTRSFPDGIPTAAVEVPDGTWLVTGASGGRFENSFLSLVDDSGGLVRAASLTGGYDVRLSDIAIVDGGWAATGSFGSADPRFGDQNLLFVLGGMSLEVSRAASVGSGTSVESGWTVRAAGQEIQVLGMTSARGGDETWFVAFDGSGTVVRQFVFNGLSAQDFALTADGNIVSAGGGVTSTLSRFDVDGKLLWKSRLRSILANHLHLETIAVSADGVFVAGGVETSADGRGTSWILRLADDGRFPGDECFRVPTDVVAVPTSFPTSTPTITRSAGISLEEGASIEAVDLAATTTGLCTTIEQFVPAAAHASGLLGSFFVSDVVLFNPVTNGAASVTVEFLDSGKENPTPASVPLALGPGQTTTIADIGKLRGTEPWLGALRLSSGQRVRAWSRTYDASASGTKGQSIPALPPETAIGPGTTAYLFGLRDDDAFRSNVGFLNIEDHPVLVGITVFSGPGLPVGSTEMTIPSRGHVQVRLLRSVLGCDITDARLEIVPDGRCFAYASIVDNGTNDSSFVLAAP